MKYLSLKILFIVIFFLVSFFSFFSAHSLAYNYSDLTVTGITQYISPSAYQINNLLQDVNCSTIKYAAIQQGTIDSLKTYYANLLNIYEGFGNCQQLGANSIKISNINVIPPAGNGYFIVISTVPSGSTGYGTGFFQVSISNPTPPQDITLSVPELKQYDLPWGIQNYDLARIWSPQNPTIARWGCALTSATMVLEYFGIKKLPGGLDLDPGSLNTWLRFEKDGYVANGLVNWLALQRLSKQAKLANNITDFDALQYQQSSSEDTQMLVDGLHNNIPSILEEQSSSIGTHFVVAKGIVNNDIQINDPYFRRTSLMTAYSGHFFTIGQFIPSYTDLSYILLITDPHVSVVVKDQNGAIVARSFVQHPLNDDIDGGIANAHDATMLYYAMPKTGIYDISLESSDTNKHDLLSYLYDESGNVAILKENISFTFSLKQDLLLMFDKSDSSLDTESLGYAFPFARIFADLSENHLLGNIDNGAYDSLYALLLEAQKSYLSGELSPTYSLLNTLQKVLSAKEGKGLTQASYGLLVSDVQLLLNSL